MEQRTNYPDVLGYITGNKRSNIQVVQAAVALRPRVVRAGRPFEMLLLVQNACDLDLEVTATLRLPDKDAKGHKERFVSKADRLVVRLEPAAVGLVVLPLSTLPDAAPGADYKIGMDVKIVPVKKDKPNRIRAAEGGGDFQPDRLPDELHQTLDELKELPWAAMVRGTVLEAGLTVMSGTVGTFADLSPSWTPLWTLRNHTDKRLLLRHFGTLVKDRLLPQFTLRQVFPVIQEYTEKYFQKSKYKLKETEINLITRLLTLLFLYASTDGKKAALMTHGAEYNIAKYFEESYTADPNYEVNLPEWFVALLELLNKDARMAEYPVKAAAHFLYEDLLRDAMLHAFTRIEDQTDIEMGSLPERQAYIRQVLEAMHQNTLDFDKLYMPLVLGGIVVADQVTQKGEKPAEFFAALRKIYDERYKEKNDENAATFDLTYQLIELMANKFTGNQW